MCVDHGQCVFSAKPAAELQTHKHVVINYASMLSEGQEIFRGLIACQNLQKSYKAHTVTSKISI